MANDFGIDNEGTGFDDLDEDFDAMFSEAQEAYADENDVDQATLSEDEDGNVRLEQKGKKSRGIKVTPKDEPAPEVKESEEQEEEQSPVPEAKEEKPAPKIVEERAPEPVVEEAPVLSPPSAPPQSTSSFASGMKIPRAGDQIPEVQRIIAILDVYRGLPSMNRNVVNMFLTRGKDVSSEAEAVVHVLNADKLLIDSIKALHDAKKIEPVKRVFFLLKLPENVFASMKTLLSIFSAEVKTSPSNRLDYAEELVFAIDKLEDDIIKHIDATESVLTAGL